MYTDVKFMKPRWSRIHSDRYDPRMISYTLMHEPRLTRHIRTSNIR